MSIRSIKSLAPPLYAQFDSHFSAYNLPAPLGLLSSLQIGSRAISLDIRKVTLLQRWYRSQTRGPGRWYKVYAAYRVHAASKGARKRFKVLTELLTSEETYATDLSLCASQILTPLFSSDLISARDQEEIFRNLPYISRLATDFYQSLCTRWTWFPANSRFAELLQLLAEELLASYALFVKGYTSSLQRLTALQESSPALQQFFNTCRSSSEAKKKIDSYLVMPCQRFPRYEMLFEQILQLTPADHVDHGPLRNLLQIIKNTTEDIDRQTRARNQLIAIQKTIAGAPDIVTLNRFHIREGDLTLPLGKKHKPTKVHCFLFSDLILCVSPLAKLSKKMPGITHEFVRMTLLQKNMVVLNYIDRRPRDLYEHEHCFGLALKDLDGNIDLILKFWCGSESSKDSWLLDVSSCLNLRVITQYIDAHHKKS